MVVGMRRSGTSQFEKCSVGESEESQGLARAKTQADRVTRRRAWKDPLAARIEFFRGLIVAAEGSA